MAVVIGPGCGQVMDLVVVESRTTQTSCRRKNVRLEGKMDADCVEKASKVRSVGHELLGHHVLWANFVMRSLVGFATSPMIKM